MKFNACKWLCTILLSLVFGSGWAVVPTSWQTVAPGLEYARLGDFPNFPNGYVHAFRIDLKHYSLRVVATPNDQSSDAGFAQLLGAYNAVLGTNGGFFTARLTPLGLRIDQGRTLNAPTSVSWGAVFYVRNKQGNVVKVSGFHPDKAIDFAVQAGPRLITDGKSVDNLKPDIDNRTALGVTRDGKVILLATDNLLLSLPDLSVLMQRPQQAGGLDCTQAMNLDGGSSTQLYTRIANFSLQLPSSSRVADAVVVVPG